MLLVLGDKRMDELTELRMTKAISIEDQKLVELSLEVIDLVFKEFNKTVCSNCPDVERYNKELGNKQKHRTKEAGCCTECSKYNGFFNECQIEEHPNKLLELKKAYLFDKKYGFFDITNHCCKLPRINRSTTCLRHCCNVNYERLVNEAVSIVRNFKLKYGLLY
jgi:hypothetical protein